MKKLIEAINLFFGNGLINADKAKIISQKREAEKLEKLKEHYYFYFLERINDAIDSGLYEVEIPIDNECIEITKRFIDSGYRLNIKSRHENDIYPIVNISWK
jgi:hypothetical protein